MTDERMSPLEAADAERWTCLVELADAVNAFRNVARAHLDVDAFADEIETLEENYVTAYKRWERLRNAARKK